MTNADSLRIIPVTTRSERKAFITFPWKLYSTNPNWVPPLLMEEKKRINPKKNPFFKHGQAQLWMAYRGNEPVGRISAQINFLHNERYTEKTGHFGFFECIEDPLVAIELLRAAQEWLREKGMERIVGPMNFSINEAETGVLVEGFDTPPYPFMPYHLPYYDRLLTTAGFAKEKDLYAWSFDAERPVTDTALQIADYVSQYPGLVVREFDKAHMERDVRIISDVFNSAWEKNWSFVPWTEEEIKIMAKEMKMVLEPKMALIAEVDGKPAAISLALPNFHEHTRDLNGRLFPFGIFKFLYRLKRRKTKGARLILLGVKKEFRGEVLGGLSVLLYSEMRKRGKLIGLTGGELSWTLEDNEKINAGIEMMGGVQYKRFRVYGKGL